MASEPELWRDAVLRSLQKEAASSTTTSSSNRPPRPPRTTGVITAAGPSWKDTLVQLLYPDKYSRPHCPLPVRGVYSDYLHRLHSCRSFTIPSSWFRREGNVGNEGGSGAVAAVDRIPWQDMTVDRFEEQYEKRNVPVVIDGAAQSWRAFAKWKDAEYLLDQTEGQSFRATSGAAALPGQFEMRGYLEYCRSETLEEAPLYLFDRDALKPGSRLWNDYAPDLHRTCPYFDPLRVGSTHDLFGVLGEGKRPDHTWLIVGPRRSGSVFHIDPNATHAWNANIVGTKRWIFYPPGITPPGVYPSGDGDQVALPLSIGEWIFQFWDEHERRKCAAPPSQRPLECTAHAGDVVFVPHGWWHLVVNFDGLNVAVTHNYASESNLPSVLKFLSEKRHQVSGCRDRPDSIKPDQLYELFVDALRERHPEMTERLLRDPRWACKAWTSDVGNGHGDGSCCPESKGSRRRRAHNAALQRASRPLEGQTGSGTTSIMTKAKSGDCGFSFSFLASS
jgi:hypothetical protein